MKKELDAIGYANLIKEKSGYSFKNISLAMQAFKRSTFCAENGGVDNEVLEFFGDKVLDNIVNIYFHNEFNTLDMEGLKPLKDEGELTRLHQVLVKKEYLAERIEALGLKDYLLMGKCDINAHREREASVKEDLFEAIVGAIAIDAGFNNERIYEPVIKLLEPHNKVYGKYPINYVEEIQRYSLKATSKLPEYSYFKTDNNYFGCNFRLIYFTPEDRVLIKIKEQKLEDCLYYNYVGFSKSKDKAREEACKSAYNNLKRAGLIGKTYDETRFDEVIEIIGGVDDSREAVTAYNKLVTKGLVSKAKFTYDGDNNYWYCKMFIDGKLDHYSGDGDSKKEAREWAIYEMICDLQNQAFDKNYEAFYNFDSPIQDEITSKEYDYDIRNTDYISLAKDRHMKDYKEPLVINVEKGKYYFEARISIPNPEDMEIYRDLELPYSEDKVFECKGETENLAKNAVCKQYYEYMKGFDEYISAQDDIDDCDLPF